MPQKTISIIVPCFNEEGNIDELYSRVCKQFSGDNLNLSCEVLFIDDGSTDKTLQKIKSLAGHHPDVRYISFSRNFGHQNALKAGIDHACGDAVITIDADLQHPPELLRDMISLWQEGYRVINTKRQDSRNQSLLKRILSGSFYRLLNLMMDTKIESGTADFRLMDRKLILELRNLQEDYLFYRGLIPWMGFKQKTIEYLPDKRFSGKTKYSFRLSSEFALTGITSFSIKPLRLSTLFGVFLAIISLAYACYALYISVFTDRGVKGWTSVIVSVLFIGALQLIILGILGEYLGKLFMESKRRPNYIIDETNI
jgi:dolichol-phosphate mannosyltransferase